MSMSFLEEMDQLIRARYTMIYVVTWEEDRARHLLMRIAERQHKRVFEWTITEGLRGIPMTSEEISAGTRLREPLAVLNEILQSDAEALYLLKDFHNHTDTPGVVRQLRDLSQALRRSKKTVIFLSPRLSLPPDLEKSITIIDLPLPSYDDLKALLSDTLSGQGRSFRVHLSDAERDTMIKAALGLTFAEAENAFARAIVSDGVLDIKDIDVIANEKKQIIRKTEVLECCDVSSSIGAVGGMDLLKDWLKKRFHAFGEPARKYGLPQPKGILLMGVQGCGKSLLAKTIASSWHLPLLRMDMSRIFHSYVGSSEQNMRKAIGIAESIAPVVLWIDEIEKAFAGSGGGDMDGGTSHRVLGMFLTWLQEKTAPVFIVATANDVKGLPPELLRKGRLDEIFFVDLPTGEERLAIFKIQLKKYGRDPDKFDTIQMAKAAEGFSGAEIEEGVVAAMHDSFFENRELETRDVLKSLQDSVPLSKTMREKITTLREWSFSRARPVSSEQPQPTRTGTG